MDQRRNDSLIPFYGRKRIKEKRKDQKPEEATCEEEDF